MRRELITCDMCGKETTKPEKLILPVYVHDNDVMSREMDVCTTCVKEIVKKTNEIMSSHGMRII